MAILAAFLTLFINTRCDAAQIQSSVENFFSNFSSLQESSTDDTTQKNTMLDLFEKSAPLLSEGSNKPYVFNPAVLQSIVQEVVDMNLHDIKSKIEAIHAKLTLKYGPIAIRQERRWIFNYAGGAMGQLTILYASPKEYLIFFGSPVGTEGFSGRYLMDIWDTVFDGKMLCYHEAGKTYGTDSGEDFTRYEYGPGQKNGLTGYLPQGKTKGYMLPPGGAYMLEYGRGTIAQGFYFGVIASASTHILDYKAAYTQLYDFATTAVKTLSFGLW